jgi:hypothetical protein
MAEPSTTRAKLTTAFGWIAGGAAGLIANYVCLLVATGALGIADEAYPVVPTTFALFLVGAFSGMAIADRMGERGFRTLGISAGVLLALLVAVALTVMLTPAE